MRSLISVIVPVYNMEDCIDKCVSSILNQTYTNIELILVDDGSSDRTGELCEQYKNSDKRVKVLHKSNGGTSEARNVGLQMASGEYIGFVDGDDYIEPDFYEVLYSLIVRYNTDISMVSYNLVKGSEIEPRACSAREYVMSKHIGLQELLMDKKVQNYVWNKLYKREMFEGLSFPVDVIYDDICIMYDIFKKSSSIAYKEIAKYNYCFRTNSIINTHSHKKRQDALDSVLVRFRKVETDFPELKKYSAFSVVLWMIRLYIFTVRENDSDVEFIIFQLPLMRKLYEEYGLFILDKLDPLKRVVLFIMLWDVSNGREVINTIYGNRKDAK